MEKSKPSRILIELTNGEMIIGRCLPTIDRQEFLTLWQEAWALISESMLANAAASSGEKWKAVAHLFDNNREFKFYCRKMLTLFNIPIDRLDIWQVSQLLFFSDKGQGDLVDLQFPPMPPGGEPPSEEDHVDPAARMLGMIAYRSGSWSEALKAINEIPYDQLVMAFHEQKKIHDEEVSKSRSGGKSNIPPPSLKGGNESDRAAKTELVRQQAERIRNEGARQAMETTLVNKMMEMGKQNE